MDRTEMADIYQRHKNTVYRTAYTYCRSIHDAEDITQEVFLTRFAAEKVFPTFGDEKAWLIRVTINRCKNLLKSFRRTHNTSLDEASGIADKPRQTEVMAAVEQLPDKYRILIYLHYIEGYTLREKGKLTSTPESTVQTRIHRARKQLKRLLKEDF